MCNQKYRRVRGMNVSQNIAVRYTEFRRTLTDNTMQKGTLSKVSAFSQRERKNEWRPEMYIASG